MRLIECDMCDELISEPERVVVVRAEHVSLADPETQKYYERPNQVDNYDYCEQCWKLITYRNRDD